MRIRTILLAAPVVLVLLFAAAYLMARPYFGQRQDQLTIQSIGEPERLNPILSTTTAASIIQYFVFDGLMQLDENAELQPNLADSYELSQTTRLYFASLETALAAAKALAQHQADWQKTGIRDVKVEGDALVLELTRPGTAYRDTVLEWIAPARPVPVQRWEGSIRENTTFQGKPVTSDTFIEWTRQARAKEPGQPRVLYVWRDTQASFEIFTVGADGVFIDRLQQGFADSLGAKAEPAKAAGVPATRPATPPATVPAAGPATAPAMASAPATAPATPAHMQPALAGPLVAAFDRDWPAQDEPLITFHLRKGVRWHDGEPFTSADVEFTYQALMNEKNASPRRSDFEMIRSLERPDDHTVLVRYKEPYSPCLYSWGMDIIPRHILAREEDLRNLKHSDFDRRPIGTGAYRLREWVTDQHILLVRNDDYWQGRPHLPRIVYRIIPDPTVSQLEFQTGGYDYTPLEPHQVERYKNDKDYTIFTGPTNSYVYIGWNLKNPLFQDVRVRRALAHAVDTESIIQYIMYGNAAQATGPYAPVTAWWTPDVKPLGYDPQRARALLAEAGWRDTDGDGVLDRDGKPFRFTLISNNGNIVRTDIAVLVQQYLQAIGIDVKVNLYEWAVFIKNYIDSRNYDACVLAWSLSFDQDLYQLWHSSQAPPPALNFVSYSNPEVDRLIERARTEFDMDKVKQYAHEIQRRIYDDQPYLFLFYPESNAAMAHGLYKVRRPDRRTGQWIEEPIRRTKLGFTIYQKWWMRDQPALAP